MADRDISAEEFDKISRSFKDPEFMRAFQDYAKEISTPEALAEHEAYLQQLESEGRAEEVYGRGVQLVTPRAALVLKTRAAGGGPKVFINICTSDKIAKPLTRQTEQDGRRGCHLEIPHCLGRKPREGPDSKGAPAQAWDFVVHPDTVQQAAAVPGVMEILAEVAKESVAGAAGRGLSKEHKVIRSTYKGLGGAPGPSTMVLRPDGAAAEANADGRLKPGSGAHSLPVPGVPAEAQSGARAPDAAGVRDAPGRGAAAGAAAAAQARRSGFSFQKPRGSAPPARGGSKGPHDGERRMCADAPAAQDGASGTKWCLVHRVTPELADTWSDTRCGGASQPGVPKELVLHVELPGVASITAIELDVAGRAVTLSAGGRHSLAVDLPHAVDAERCRARFDRHKQQLAVTMPVLPPPPPPAAATLPPQEPAPPARAACGLSDGIEAAESASGGSDGGSSCSSSERFDADAVAAPPSCGDASMGMASAAPPECKAEADETGTQLPNELKWAQLHARTTVPAAAAHTPSVAAAEEGAKPAAAAPASAALPAGGAAAAPQRLRAAIAPRVLGGLVDELD